MPTRPKVLAGFSVPVGTLEPREDEKGQLEITEWNEGATFISIIRDHSHNRIFPNPIDRSDMLTEAEYRDILWLLVRLNIPFSTPRGYDAILEPEHGCVGYVVLRGLRCRQRVKYFNGEWCAYPHLVPLTEE